MDNFSVILGRLGTHLGGFGDCTATLKGSNTETFGEVLNQNDHAGGNQVMYSGFTGEQLTGDIFIDLYLLYAFETYGKR